MAIEHPNYPGFYFIPNASRTLVSKEGATLTFLTKTPVLRSYDDVNKRIVIWGDKPRSVRILRLLAEVFAFLDVANTDTKVLVPTLLEGTSPWGDRVVWVSREDYYQSTWISKRIERLKTFGYLGVAHGFGVAEPVNKHPGFFFIPGCLSLVCINREGILYDLESMKIIRPRLNKKGYLIVDVYLDGKIRSVSVHRLVGRTFIVVPVKYKDHHIRELQINHMDGVKTNNKVSNLEWVTNSENMTHARLNKLFSTEKPVIGRSITNGNIVRYQSVSSAARVLLTTPVGIYKYISSPLAGRVAINGYVYKYDDGTPWPVSILPCSRDNPLDGRCDVIGIHESGYEYLFMTLAAAAEHIGVSVNVLKNHRQRHGVAVPFQGWVILRLCDVTSR